MTKAKKVILFISLLSLPSVLYAAPTTLKDLFILIAQLFNAIIPVLVALAMLYFFWGVSKLILYNDNEQKRREGINTVIWGLIALFVIVSVWGLVFVFTQTFFGVSGVPGYNLLPSAGSL